MNNKAIKIVTIGGGSSYTPELAEGFIKRAKFLPIKEWALVDINEGDGPKKLDIIHALVERMFKKAGLDTKITKHLNRRDALKDADFVTTQLRVGRLDARAKDERIPLSNGFIGQETNGAGGLFKALRTIPVVLDIVKDVKELAPNAWIVNFTNPAGIVTQAVAKYGNFDKFIGVCNVPINTKIGVAKYLGTTHDRIQYNVAGLNHFVYFTDFWKDGINVKAQVLNAAKDPVEFQKFQPENIKATIFDKNLIEELDAMPCGYHRYYYNRGTILHEYLEHFKTNTTRAEEVIKYEASLFEKYKDPNLNTKPIELEKRGGAHYSEVACAVVNAIFNDTGEEMVVSTINKGHIKNFEDGLTVESIARITAHGALPVERENRIPDIALQHVQLIKKFELMTAEAAYKKDSALALAALQINPLSEDSLVARKVFNELLDAHAPYLKGFKKL